MKVRKANERGVTEIGWLHSRHTFSFGRYQDQNHMGYRTLRVINDDVVEPGGGFGTHGHRDMEIISIVLEGELAHQDSLGHGEVLRVGEVQVMTAGSGIEHSEFNPSREKRSHFMQIWILPERKNLEPAYDQRVFDRDLRLNNMVRVAGPKREVEDRALPIHQDADVYLLTLEGGREVNHTVGKGRGIWVQVLRGTLTVNGQVASTGDGVVVEESDLLSSNGSLNLKGTDGTAEVVVFDLK